MIAELTTPPRASLALAVSLAALCACEAVQIPPAEPGLGQVAELDAASELQPTGWWPSLALDSRDRAHLSYCDAGQGDLRYALRDDGGWSTTTVISEGRVGKYTAIAVDGHDRPAIAFYDQDRKALRYAWQAADGTWSDERVHWGLEAGMAGELRFDRDDTAHLFFYVPTGRLLHARKAVGQAWQIATVTEATAGFSARIGVAAGPDGYWLSLVDWDLKDTRLRLARPDQGGYRTELVDNQRGAGWHSALVLTDGQPEIYYTRSAKHDLRRATPTDDGWRSTRVLRDVQGLAAARAPNGELVIAYQDLGPSRTARPTVKLLRGRGETWRRFVIDEESPTGDYLTLAVDRQGRALVVYFVPGIGGLRVYDESVPP